jgi:squalene cyclase
VLLALSRVKLPGLTGRPAIRNAVRWLTGMQGRDGSWSSSAPVTAHVVRALATQDAEQTKAIRRGVVWLLRQQRSDGSWPGPDGASEFGAIVAVLPALIAAGVRRAKPPVTTAVDWLLVHQNADGGWADDERLAASGMRRVPSGARAGVSEAQATARALTALLCAGGAQTADAIDRGVDWLVHAQQADGGWRDNTKQVRQAAAQRQLQTGSSGGAATYAARNSTRRRGAIVPGLLLPLGALGRYVAVAESGAESRADVGADIGADAGADTGVDAGVEASAAAGAIRIDAGHRGALTAAD